MQLLKIYTAPDPILKQVSEPVAEDTPAIQQTLKTMLETMYHAEGIGLAAPQVGIHQRMITIDLQRRGRGNVSAEGQPLFLINPVVLESTTEMSVYDEGCLSIPDHYAEVWRPARIKLGYQDLSGASQILEAEGLLATCIQHEIDHLDGVLFYDRLSALKRNMIIRKLKKTQKQAEEGTIL